MKMEVRYLSSCVVTVGRLLKFHCEPKDINCALYCNIWLRNNSEIYHLEGNRVERVI